MGLFDNLLQTATNWTAGMSDDHAKLAHGILEMVASGKSGGLPALVQSFQNNGLENVVSSWISTGKNLPVSPDQVQAVLGSQKIQELATKFGIPPDVVKTKLAEVLPLVVDRLTPNGKLPDTKSLIDEGGNLLKGNLG